MCIECTEPSEEMKQKAWEDAAPAAAKGREPKDIRSDPNGFSMKFDLYGKNLKDLAGAWRPMLKDRCMLSTTKHFISQHR